MASIKETTDDSDLAAVMQLLMSVGHLKYSMRSLPSMPLQSALHSYKETESPARLSPIESNTVLENLVNEVLSNKPSQSDVNTGAYKIDDFQHSVSVEDLELVQKRLEEEFEKRKHHFITSLSNKKCQQ